MQKNEMFSLIDFLKKSYAINFDYNNKDHQKLEHILNYVHDLLENKPSLIEEVFNSNVRFSDFYSDNLHNEDIIKYFDTNYTQENIEQTSNLFLIYVLLNKTQNIQLAFDVSDNLNDVYNFLTDDSSLQDALYLIEEFENRLNSENELPVFLNPNNRYQIMFSGYSYDDIKALNPYIKQQLIRKLGAGLSTDSIVAGSETIGHVKDAYGFNISRIRMGSDYRITFTRKNNTTVILGVVFKSGKSKDYTRYDVIATRINDIYNDVDLFEKGELPKDSQHYKTLDDLLNSNKHTDSIPKV